MTTPPSAPDSARQPDPKLDLTHVTRTEFINAMAHLYRGELGEATAWRTRIDATSNWAVVLSATALSFVFADKSSERHILIPIITLVCDLYAVYGSAALPLLRYLAHAGAADRDQLLSSDARRFAPSGCRLDGDAGSRSRVAALSHALVGSNRPAAAAQLPVDLRHPAGKLADPPGLTSHRRRRTWASIAQRAAIGPIPGRIVIAGMLAFYGALAALGVFSLWKSRVAKTLPAGHPGRLRGRTSWIGVSVIT